jgi:hypothetical protein
MSDKPKSVLDIIAWCEDLEKRLQRIEHEGLVVVDSGEVTKNNDTNMKSGNGERTAIESISFKNELRTTPIVNVSLSGLNTDSDFNSRIEVKAENITTKGFDIVMRTWGPSNVHFVKVNWTALLSL